MGPTVCRFLGVLKAGGSIGSFSTTPLLPEPTDVVAGMSGSSPLIPVSLRPGVGQIDVRDDRNPIPTKFRIRPLSPPGTIAMTIYLIPQGLSKGKTGLPTSARDRTK